MKYHRAAFFPEQKQLAWRQQFRYALMKILFDMDKLVAVVNDEQTIWIDGLPPVTPLTKLALIRALEALQVGDDRYSLNPALLQYDLLKEAGMTRSSINQLTIGERLLYQTAILAAFRLFIPRQANKRTELQVYLCRLVEQYPQFRQPMKQDALTYLKQVIQLSLPIIKLHQQFVRHDNELEATLSGLNKTSKLYRTGCQIRHLIYLQAANTEEMATIKSLIDILVSCHAVLDDPSPQTLASCYALANGLNQPTWMKRLAGLLMVLLGSILVSTSLAVLFEKRWWTDWFSARESCLTISFREQVLRGGATVVGTALSAYGSYLLFGASGNEGLLADDLEALADCVAHSL